MGTHGYDDQTPLYTWGQNLKKMPDMIGEFAGQLDELARQASDDQVAGSTLVDEIKAVAEAVRNVQKRSETWHGTFRAQHERDVGRVENPRKGLRVEANADVGKAMRDL